MELEAYKLIQVGEKTFQTSFKIWVASPEGKTGIELIDLNKDFYKENCRWVSRNERRSLKDMPNFKNRKLLFKKPRPISVLVENTYYEQLLAQKNSSTPDMPMNEFIRGILGGNHTIYTKSGVKFC